MMGIRYFNIGEMLIISKTISKVLRERRKGFIFRYLPNTDLYTILIASKQRLKTRPNLTVLSSSEKLYIPFHRYIMHWRTIHSL